MGRLRSSIGAGDAEWPKMRSACFTVSFRGLNQTRGLGAGSVHYPQAPGGVWTLRYNARGCRTSQYFIIYTVPGQRGFCHVRPGGLNGLHPCRLLSNPDADDPSSSSRTHSSAEPLLLLRASSTGLRRKGHPIGPALPKISIFVKPPNLISPVPAHLGTCIQLVCK
ncbi:hypothetical protein BJV78DRAFT_851462 [Lactifluus subvellereus]|nr:hypothetical protein BJV78DRAFT_851462 [Lactifluus subvellereus]